MDREQVEAWTQHDRYARDASVPVSCLNTVFNSLQLLQVLQTAFISPAYWRVMPLKFITAAHR